MKREELKKYLIEAINKNFSGSGLSVSEDFGTLTDFESNATLLEESKINIHEWLNQFLATLAKVAGNNKIEIDGIQIGSENTHHVIRTDVRISRDGKLEYILLDTSKEHPFTICVVESNQGKKLSEVNRALLDIRNMKRKAHPDNGDNKEEAVKVSKLASSQASKKHILVADDCPINRNLIERLLKNLLGDKVKIELACDGFEAVALFEKKIKDNSNFNFIIMDEQMPDKSGSEAVGEIREIIEVYNKNASNPSKIAHDAVQIVTWTATPQKQPAGVNGSLKKPVNSADLIKQLAAAGFVPEMVKKALDDLQLKIKDLKNKATNLIEGKSFTDALINKFNTSVNDSIKSIDALKSKSNYLLETESQGDNKSREIHTEITNILLPMAQSLIDTCVKLKEILQSSKQTAEAVMPISDEAKQLQEKIGKTQFDIEHNITAVRLKLKEQYSHDLMNAHELAKESIELPVLPSPRA